MNDVIFTSYCFDNSDSGGDYYAQQVRLKESILKIYPEANLHFKNESEAIGKPKFQQSLYGFKVDLVKECLEKGFKKIIFFDTAITLVGEVDYWFDLIKDYGVLAIADARSLDTVTSNSLKKHIRKNNRTLSKIKLVGGSVYVFDFNLEKCQSVFAQWAYFEENGFFGTQDDLSHGRLQGSRMDETAMALSFYLCGGSPVTYEQMGYGYINPSTGKEVSGDYQMIITKKHFK